MFASQTYYSLDMQVRLVPALCAVLNFIRIHDPHDAMECLQGDQLGTDIHDAAGGEVAMQIQEVRTGSVSKAESHRADARRDQIAHRMWVDYEAEKEHHSKKT